MKTYLMLCALCLAVLIAGGATKEKGKEPKILAGQSQTNFGKYEIRPSEDPMVINGQELETYELSYENASKPIQVGFLKTKKCKTFILRNEHFEIEYACEKGVFGVKKISKDYQLIPTTRNEAVLNLSQYYNQRVICQNPTSKEEILGLIACFYPMLIKEEYLASF